MLVLEKGWYCISTFRLNSMTHEKVYGHVIFKENTLNNTYIKCNLRNIRCGATHLHLLYPRKHAVTHRCEIGRKLKSDKKLEKCLSWSMSHPFKHDWNCSLILWWKNVKNRETFSHKNEQLVDYLVCLQY